MVDGVHDRQNQQHLCHVVERVPEHTGVYFAKHFIRTVFHCWLPALVSRHPDEALRTLLQQVAQPYIRVLELVTLKPFFK